MLLAYLDESYDNTTYWIAALVADAASVAALGPDLDEVVKRASDSYGTSSTAELHGHALFHGKDHWESLALMPRARIGIYRDAFRAIASHPVKIVYRGVNIPKLRAKYKYPDHPHAVVLAHLLERIDDLAAESDELALVIADQVDQADAYRKRLWQFQQAAVSGYSRQLERIIDTIHFAPSMASRMVQGADLIVYLLSRMQGRRDLDERAKRANAALWEEVNALVIPTSGCWHPRR